MVRGRLRGRLVNADGRRATCWDRGLYLSSVYYDLAKQAINRLSFGMAQDLQPPPFRIDEVPAPTAGGDDR